MTGEFHGQRSLAGYSPWGHKEWDPTERLTLSLSLQHRGNFALFILWIWRGGVGKVAGSAAPLPSVQRRAKSGFRNRFISGGGGSGAGGKPPELRGPGISLLLCFLPLPRDSYRGGLPSVLLLLTRCFSKPPLYAGVSAVGALMCGTRVAVRARGAARCPVAGGSASALAARPALVCSPLPSAGLLSLAAEQGSLPAGSPVLSSFLPHSQLF